VDVGVSRPGVLSVGAVGADAVALAVDLEHEDPCSRRSTGGDCGIAEVASECQRPAGCAHRRSVELPTSGHQDCPPAASSSARISWSVASPLAARGLGQADGVAGGHHEGNADGLGLTLFASGGWSPWVTRVAWWWSAGCRRGGAVRRGGCGGGSRRAIR